MPVNENVYVCIEIHTIILHIPYNEILRDGKYYSSTILVQFRGISDHCHGNFIVFAEYQY